VVGEEACLAWADEKEHADESDKVYLKRSAAFIQWLREAEDDDDEEEEESD
jgi:translation initiation factor eIF-2B subunit epsilon